MSKKIDVLYVVGNGSLNDDEELRYSLRCLSKHAKNLGRVIVCGKIPRFLGGMVECLPHDDFSVSGKHWNMLDKIQHGITQGNLQGEFLFSSDDHFITRNADLSEWPRYTRGEIYNEEKYVADHGKPCGKYQRSICATRRLLEHHGLPLQNIVWHGNMWLDAIDRDAVSKLALSDIGGCVYGYEPMLLFNAVYLSKHPDTKLLKLPSDVKARSYDEAVNLAETRGCFSTSDKAWENGKLLKWFKKHYPDKSEFER